MFSTSHKTIPLIGFKHTQPSLFQSIDKLLERFTPQLTDSFRLVSIERVGKRTICNFVCSACNQSSTHELFTLNNSKQIRCFVCEGRRGYEKVTPEHLTVLASTRGATFVQMYRDNKSQIKIVFLCVCGTEVTKHHTHDCTFRCAKCSHKPYKSCNQYQISDVDKWFVANNCKRMSDYINATTPMKFQCGCGLMWKTSYRPERVPRCPACATEAKKIKMSAKRKPVSETAIRDSKQVKHLLKCWKQEVAKAFWHKCFITGKTRHQTDIVAHHLNGYKSHPSSRFETANGVFIEASLHKEFHLRYDNYTGNCTAEQFSEFFLEKTGKDFHASLKELHDKTEKYLSDSKTTHL